MAEEYRGRLGLGRRIRVTAALPAGSYSECPFPWGDSGACLPCPGPAARLQGVGNTDHPLPDLSTRSGLPEFVRKAQDLTMKARELRRRMDGGEVTAVEAVMRVSDLYGEYIATPRRARRDTRGPAGRAYGSHSPRLQEDGLDPAPRGNDLGSPS
jgi:hypothetical protein